MVAPITFGFINAFIDLLVLLLPVRMVWNLQLPVKRRLAVGGIFGLGAIGVAVSIARAAAFTDDSIETRE